MGGRGGGGSRPSHHCYEGLRIEERPGGWVRSMRGLEWMGGGGGGVPESLSESCLQLDHRHLLRRGLSQDSTCPLFTV